MALFFFFVGFLMLVPAAACFALARRTAKIIRMVGAAQQLTIGELRALHDAAAQAAGPGHFRMLCELYGTIRPGPSGLLVSDLAGVECVWHSHSTVGPSLQEDSDGQLVPKGLGISILSAFSSDQPFCLDDGTGQILVRPSASSSSTSLRDRARVELMSDLEEQVHGEEDPPPGAASRGFEWVIRPGQIAYILGEVTDAGGELTMARPADGGPYYMSRQPRFGELKKRRDRQVMFTALGCVAAVPGLLCVLLGLAF